MKLLAGEKLILTLLSLLQLGVARTYSECVNDRAVRYHSVPENWFSAREMCLRNGMVLLGEYSDPDYQIMRKGMTHYNMTQSWIGLSDLAEAGTFVWTNKAVKSSNNHWAKGYPIIDHWIKRNCVRFEHKRNFKDEWVNEVCLEKLTYICEKRYDYDCLQKKRKL